MTISEEQSVQAVQVEGSTTESTAPMVPVISLSSTVGAVFALLAFAVSVVSGLQSANPADTVLGRGLVALVVCYAVGMIAGAILEYVIGLEVRRREAAEPLPEPSLPEADEVEDATDTGETPASSGAAAAARG